MKALLISSLLKSADVQLSLLGLETCATLTGTGGK